MILTVIFAFACLSPQRWLKTSWQLGWHAKFCPPHPTLCQPQLLPLSNVSVHHSPPLDSSSSCLSSSSFSNSSSERRSGAMLADGDGCPQPTPEGLLDVLALFLPETISGDQLLQCILLCLGSCFADITVFAHTLIPHTCFCSALSRQKHGWARKQPKMWVMLRSQKTTAGKSSKESVNVCVCECESENQGF